MTNEVELRGFLSMEQAREAAYKLDAQKIPCRILSKQGDMLASLFVSPDNFEKAAEIIGEDGFAIDLLQTEASQLQREAKKENFEAISEPNSGGLIKQVSSELKKAEEQKKNPLKQIGILALSIFLFASMGLFENSFRGIIVVIVVIFIHELGHLISMKLLKYKDVQMFFIPLFGAAVSGEDKAPSGIKKATVSLMGPAPGILIGIVTGIMYLKMKDPLLAEFTRTLLFINTFNLLPFHPLDGGRFFEAILFSKHPYLETGFKIITTLALGGIAFLLKAPLLGFFSVIIFLSLKSTHSAAKIAHEFRKKHCAEFDDSDDIPDECLRRLVPRVKEIIPATNPAPKLIATHISAIWQRIQNRPSKTASSLGMTFVYVAFILLGIVAFFLFSWISYAIESQTTEVITRSGTNGSRRRFELSSIGTNRFQQIELNEGNLFHGTQTNWHIYSTQISKTGQWLNGYRNGIFYLYDPQGNTNEIITYKNGIPTSYRVLTDGMFTEVPQEQWSNGPQYLQPQDKPEIIEPPSP